MNNFQTVKNYFFFSFLIISTIFFFFITKNFLFPIFWAIVFAIIFYPVYKKILLYLKGRKNTSSFLTILLLLIVFLIPLYFLLSTVASQGVDLAQKFSTQKFSQTYTTTIGKINSYPVFEKFNINPSSIEKNINTTLKTIISKIGKQALDFSQSTFSTLVSFFLSLYLLFYFFRDGEKIIKKISEILPLGDKNEKRLFLQFSEIIRGIFSGSIIVALIQSILGGIVLAIVGIQSVLLWTVLMFIASIIPAIGSSIVLVPTAIWFFITDNIASGIIVTIGALIISISDNFLRPFLMKNTVKMHDVFITISMLGGISIFGFSGFIIGPISAGIFITFWNMFEYKYKQELKNDD